MASAISEVVTKKNARYSQPTQRGAPSLTHAARLREGPIEMTGPHGRQGRPAWGRRLIPTLSAREIRSALATILRIFSRILQGRENLRKHD
jgi:hypothetical protein